MMAQHTMTVIEENAFAVWRQDQTCQFSSEETELVMFLLDQLRQRGNTLVGLRFNHPVLGLISHMSEKDFRMQELLLAYLALTVSGDSGPVKRLLAGQRLRSASPAVGPVHTQAPSS